MQGAVLEGQQVLDWPWKCLVGVRESPLLLRVGDSGPAHGQSGALLPLQALEVRPQLDWWG